jgi:hypothetical protein
MKNILLIFLIVLLIGCETEETIYQTTKSRPVFECFINPETDSVQVKIFEIIPYHIEDDTISDPISGLEVWLSTGTSDTFMLDENTSGTYEISLTEMGAAPRDSLFLETSIDGYIITAQSWLPPKPVDVTISDDAIYFDSDNPMGMISNDNITVSWENEEEAYYYVSILNIEDDPEPVNDMFEEMEEDMPKMQQAPPSVADQYEVRRRNLMYFGTYRIVVFRVNAEFANLFDNPTMSSVTLTEPPSNLENGLGIFTAYSTDTVYLEVKEQ